MTFKGFAPPTFTAQIVYSGNDDGEYCPDKFEPLHCNQDAAYRYCADLVENSSAIDFVVLVRGRLTPGQVAKKRDIVADFQPYEMAGAKQWKG